MAITPVTINTKFTEWKDITNEIITILGDNTALNTTDQSGLVAAINEVLSNVGDITTLNTTDQTSLVVALNEVHDELINQNYSATEIDTNQIWTDAKTIYRKVINVASLPNTTTANIAHGVTLDTLIKLEGLYFSATNVGGQLNDANVVMDFDGTNINLTTTTDMTTSSANIIMEYTK